MLKAILLTALVALPAMADSYLQCEGQAGDQPFTAIFGPEQIEVIKGHGVTLELEPAAENREHIERVISEGNQTTCRFAGVSTNGVITGQATDCGEG